MSGAIILGVGGQGEVFNSDDGDIELSNLAFPSRDDVDVAGDNREVCPSALQETHIHDGETFGGFSGTEISGRGGGSHLAS